MILVSENSSHLEEVDESGDDKYKPLTKASLVESDVVIDFSKPNVTMILLDYLQGSGVALVVGTTGFKEIQSTRLNSLGDTCPVLIGSNFTYGFEPFEAAGIDLVNAISEAQITVGEVYHQHKKLAASGTTQRLCKSLSETSSDKSEKNISQDIQRIGDTPGINTIRLELGFATMELKLTVHSRRAYAAGALKAARWLIDQSNGLYTPKDLYA